MLWLRKANLHNFMLETNYHKAAPFICLPIIWNENISSESETYVNDTTNLFSVCLQKHIRKQQHNLGDNIKQVT